MTAALELWLRSGLGQTRKSQPVRVMSAFPLEADTSRCADDVGLRPSTEVAGKPIVATRRQRVSTDDPTVHGAADNLLFAVEPPC